MAIGILSAVVDNVPLVAGAMGMYPIEDAAHYCYPDRSGSHRLCR